MKHFFSSTHGWPFVALWILLVGVATQARAQAPAWQTAMAVNTGSGIANVKATIADANGNIEVVHLRWTV
ncbi:hypothetical protein [Hymenobacter rubidus]|uniref:hypothetical protein n=1 Tax=Hymenobacter rubidus TaxID=1441626 RepID=UPI00191E236E|nr:hypothetical protein [Hymenobacter rubidus]